MKICFLASADSIHSHKWIKFFAEAGHKICWISFSPQGHGAIKGMQFHQIDPLPIGFLNVIKYAFRVRSIVRDFRPDVMHAYYAGIYGLAGALSGFKPMVLTAWGSDIFLAARSFFKRALIKYALDHSAVITCDAQQMVSAIKNLSIDDNKIKVIYFGIDTEWFSPRKVDSAVRHKLNPDGAPLVISLRSHLPVYDLGTLVHAVPFVLEEIPEARFLIAGTGPETDNLKALSESYGIEQNIVFLGRYDSATLSDYLSSSDVYVSTSLSDAGIAVSTAEAMACAVPVVITDSGENDNWIDDGKYGFLFPVKKPGELAE